MDKILAIALTTYRELMRSKILYLVIFFSMILVGVSALFGIVTIGDQVKVIKDFGLMTISLFSTAFAIISGTALLSKELSRKTIYNILAKPVQRWQFLLGKYLGMWGTASTLVLMMAGGLLVFLSFFENGVDFLLIQAIISIIFELIIVCAAAIFFSAIVVTPVLAGMFTVAVFIAGRSCEYILYFIREGLVSSEFAKQALRVTYLALPHLDMLHISNDVVYGVGQSFGFFVISFLHAVGYAAVLLTLAQIIFRRREFN
jgi:Cu-processing system permease protein